MKIAFISYEYPPDTAVGGIATYIFQIAQVLKQRGHHVEVFSASPYRSGRMLESDIIVHRITGVNQTDFSKAVGAIFANRHQEIQFDVLEGPDYKADASEAVRLVRDIPLVIKLHTPSFILSQNNYIPLSFHGKLRMVLGAIRRGKIVKLPKPVEYDPTQDLERNHILEADEISAPSLAVAHKVSQLWKIEPENIKHIPNPFVPSKGFLEIPVGTYSHTVTFIGRLEVRKGVVDFGLAIPHILKSSPQVKFRFVGASLPSPTTNLSMKEYLTKLLWSYRSSLEFAGQLDSAQVLSVLKDSDICVFPSIWENFPNVCLEAMAAARGVVGSSAGGMAELLDNGNAGLLVPPQNPEAIAKAVIKLLENPDLRMQLGQTARARVLSEYNSDRIGALQEASYERAIQRRKALGFRPE